MFRSLYKERKRKRECFVHLKRTKNAKEHKRTQECCILLKRTYAQPFQKSLSILKIRQQCALTFTLSTVSIYCVLTRLMTMNSEQKIRSDIREEKKQRTQPPIVNIHIQKQ